MLNMFSKLRISIFWILHFHRNLKIILGCCIPTLRRSFLRMGYKERLLGGFIRSRQAGQTSRLNRKNCYRRRYCSSQQGGPPQERQLKNYFSLLNTKFQTKYKLLLQSLKILCNSLKHIIETILRVVNYN